MFRRINWIIDIKESFEIITVNKEEKDQEIITVKDVENQTIQHKYN